MQRYSIFKIVNISHFDKFSNPRFPEFITLIFGFTILDPSFWILTFLHISSAPVTLVSRILAFAKFWQVLLLLGTWFASRLLHRRASSSLIVLCAHAKSTLAQNTRKADTIEPIEFYASLLALYFKVLQFRKETYIHIVVCDKMPVARLQTFRIHGNSSADTHIYTYTHTQ